jgi:hypothetical protein
MTGFFLADFFPEYLELQSVQHLRFENVPHRQRVILGEHLILYSL